MDGVSQHSREKIEETEQRERKKQKKQKQREKERESDGDTSKKRIADVGFVKKNTVKDASVLEIFPHS